MASRGKIPDGGYVQFVDPENGLKGARIGVLRDMFRSGPVHEEALALIETAIEDLTGAGAYVIDPVSTGLPLLSLATRTRVTSWEKKAATDYYLSGLGPDAMYKDLTEMIAANPEHLQRLRDRDAVDDLDSNPDYLARIKNRDMMGQALLSLMEEFQLDALVFPFKTFPASKIADGWNNREADNAVSSQTGFPGLLVPAGFTKDNLPIRARILGTSFQRTHTHQARLGLRGRFEAPEAP